MIVEFVGVSGAGKTTCAKEYYKETRNKGEKIEWPAYRLDEKYSWFVRNVIKSFFIIPFSILHLGWFFSVFVFLKRMNLNLGDRAILLYHAILLKISCIKYDHCASQIIMDEGPIHYSWSIYMRTQEKPDPKIISEVINLFGFPAIVYHITAKSDTICKRLVDRGRKTRILDSRDLVKIVDNSIHYLEEIISIVRNENNSLVVHQVDNDLQRNNVG